MESIETQINGSGFFSDEELSRIEETHADGLSSGEIIQLLSRRGLRFSEATFRKYVQLELLPRSRRVGSKGKHKGSRGVYPAGTVRQINEIKRLMALDYTIEEIRHNFAFVGGDIEELHILIERILSRLKSSLEHLEHGELVATDMRQQIAQARVSAEDLVSRIEAAATRIRQLGQLAREAV